MCGTCSFELGGASKFLPSVARPMGAESEALSMDSIVRVLYYPCSQLTVGHTPSVPGAIYVFKIVYMYYSSQVSSFYFLFIKGLCKMQRYINNLNV